VEVQKIDWCPITNTRKQEVNRYKWQFETGLLLLLSLLHRKDLHKTDTREQRQQPNKSAAANSSSTYNMLIMSNSRPIDSFIGSRAMRPCSAIRACCRIFCVLSSESNQHRLFRVNATRSLTHIEQSLQTRLALHRDSSSLQSPGLAVRAGMPWVQ
jgi:hypothetical protein